MGVGKFGHKGTLLAKQRFIFLLNYLDRAGIKDYNKGEVQKKIGITRKLSIINWVEFDLQPTSLSRVYKILLVYIEGYSPYAYVLTPSLNKLKKDNTPIPHLYDYERYRLCLHYPHLNEYSQYEEIGQQYVPWIIHWLYYFEEWLYTGEWKGGGVEPGDEIDRELNPKYKKENTSSSKKKEIGTFVTAIDEADKIYDRRLKKLLKEFVHEAA
ncbi:MAG: hypothetical protein ACERKK_05920 [Poseidonibacter sp.]|uniref:hypothetical protein n=1 Tax=Poseidonibacter sp. TaxID=2321188 RepID=UPI00359D7A48